MTARAGRPRALHLARLDLRADRAGSLSLAILLLVTTTLAMAAPIVFTGAADAALPTMMAAAPPLQRDLAFTLQGRLDGPPSDPLAEVLAAGERLQADLPPSVAGLVDHGVTAADTPELAADGLAGDGYTAGLRLRAQPNIEQRIRFVEGRAPEATDDEVTEIAVSAETLGSLRSGGWILGRPLAVGDQVTLNPERGDSLPVRIVGTFEPLEPTNDEWADGALVAPRVIIQGDGDSVAVHATALIATAQVASVAGRFGGAFDYAWRFILDWGGSGAAAATIAAELGTLRVKFPFRGSTEGSDVPSVSTGLLTILERYIAERSTAQAAIILALIGPAAAAVGALGMIAATIARRRQSAVRVIRARGATDRQVILTRLILALVIVVPATALPATAMIVLAGPAWAVGIGLIALAMAVLTLALVIITTRHVLREDAGLLRQARPTAWWGGPRSLVRDGLLVAVAVAGVIWIGQRGATAAAGSSTNAVTPASALVGVDPLLVLVPTIVALTGGLIAWRCYLPIVRVLSAVAAAYRGFVPVHALRGPSRGGGALQVPLVILVVTLAIGVFSTIVVASLQRQQDLVAWMAVGAEFRIDSATRDNLPLGVADVPGVESAAEVVLRDGFLAGGSVRAMPVVAEALDAEAYRRVVAGTPADGLLPEAFTSTAWDGSAGTTPETAIPAILVGQAARRPALSVGQAFELSGLGRASHFRVAAVEAEFPGAGSPQGTVIVPAGAVRAADPTHAFAPNQIFVRASPALGAAMRERTVGRFGAPNVALASRADVRAGLESDPLVRDTSTGFLLAFGVALGFAALVVAAAVVGDVAARHGEIALLRALGTRPRQVLGVIVVEQGTVVITAVLGGLALGCLMGLIAVPSLGLDQFVRPGQIVEATIEWPVVSGVAIAQAALALMVMLAATLVARRRDPVPAMMRDA